MGTVMVSAFMLLAVILSVGLARPCPQEYATNCTYVQGERAWVNAGPWTVRVR